MSRVLRLHTRSGQGSILEAAGIYPEYVEMEIDDVGRLAFSAAHQATCAKDFQAGYGWRRKGAVGGVCQQGIALEIPHGCTPVGSHWVFHVKQTADGSIEWYKAHLVAHEFSQQPGWDYVKSLAPTIRLSVVHALFALVAADDLECDSINITTAFLNGDLEEEIYMKPPEGYEQYSRDGYLLYCLLLKAPYGLKHGGRQWYLKLSEVMKEIGFRKVHSEPCVYLWEDSTGGKVVVPMYVDDCHIIGKTKEGT